MTETRVRSNIQRFYETVTMPGGYSFSHVEMLKMIDLYYNSKYKTGQYDNLGFRKFFYNIVKPACDIATKFIDLDTKDIILSPEGRDDELPTWLMQKKLKLWLEDSSFAELLNEIAFNLPKYGHVVVKKVKNEWELVNLQNIRIDPAVDCIDDSPYFYELISMTKGEIKKMKGWKTSELFARGDDEQFVIYDCYDQIDGTWKHTVYGDLFTTKTKDGMNRNVESELDNRDDYLGATELFTETIEDIKEKYRELRWEKVPGRWLGYGFVEYLEENQVAINEAENLERKGLMFSSLKLWQTRDENIAGQNLSVMSNGQILPISSEITPIAMEERNLAAYNNTRSNWTANTERKTFTSDITTGASLPSRTPLGVANLQATFATSYFELKRENYGIFVKDMLYEDIIPSFVQENSKEHTLMFAYSDQDKADYDKLCADILVGDAVVAYALKTGFFPSATQKEQLRQTIMNQIAKNKNSYAKIPKDFYKNAKHFIRINITGESMDNGTKSQVIQMALNIVGTNPAILQNKAAKGLLFALLGLGGISPADLGLMSEDAMAPQQMPQDPNNPQAGQAQQGQMAGSMARPQPMSPQMMAGATAI